MFPRNRHKIHSSILNGKINYFWQNNLIFSYSIPKRFRTITLQIEGYRIKSIKICFFRTYIRALCQFQSDYLCVTLVRLLIRYSLLMLMQYCTSVLSCQSPCALFKYPNRLKLYQLSCLIKLIGFSIDYSF